MEDGPVLQVYIRKKDYERWTMVEGEPQKALDGVIELVWIPASDPVIQADRSNGQDHSSREGTSERLALHISRGIFRLQYLESTYSTPPLLKKKAPTHVSHPKYGAYFVLAFMLLSLIGGLTGTRASHRCPTLRSSYEQYEKMERVPLTLTKEKRLPLFWTGFSLIW